MHKDLSKAGKDVAWAVDFARKLAGRKHWKVTDVDGMLRFLREERDLIDQVTKSLEPILEKWKKNRPKSKHGPRRIS